MKLLENTKKAFKSKYAKVTCSALCLMMAVAPAVLAEGETVTTSNEQITDAMNTAIQGTISSAYAMFVGLIPVGLQIMSAFVIFKLGKKFFGKVTN